MDCKIRSWTIEDAVELAKIINNKKILDNLRDGIPFPYTQNDAEEFINSMLSSDKNKVFAFAITVNEKVVGSIGVFRKENIHSQTAEIGYFIAENYWGKGIGSCALKQACNYIFENTNIIRVFAEPFIHNIGSCRILEKCDFVFEGVLRKNAVKNGNIIDMKMYSLTK